MRLHIIGERSAVWKVGSEEKQLKGRKYGRKYPKHNKPNLGKPNEQNVKHNCHKYQLEPGDIVFHKYKPPYKEVVAVRRKIRIIIGSRMKMMLVMFFRKVGVG